MTIQQAYNDVRKALQKHDVNWMPELTIESLTVNPTTYCDNDQAWLQIQSFKPNQGWIQTLDHLHLITSDDLQQTQDHVISAELVNADHESLHIRPANKGQLSLTRFTPNQGETYYVTQTQHQIKHVSKTESGTQAQTGNAVYQLYWPTHQTQTQPAFSRLVEIHSEGK